MGLDQLKNYKKFYSRFGLSGVNLLRDELAKKELIKFEHSEVAKPLFLRGGTTDIEVFMQVIFNQEYKIHFSFQPEYIMDLGANVGYTAVHFANRFPNSKIISVEPESENYNLLVKNTEHYKNVIPVKAGVWNKSTSLKIVNDKVASWGFMVVECDKNDEGALPAVSITDLMKTYNFPHIDILKIDIEGSEKELFEQDYDFWLSKTKLMLVETHDGMRKGAAKSLFKALENYDYHLSTSGENLLIRFNH